jgi:hypothetical protein
MMAQKKLPVPLLIGGHMVMQVGFYKAVRKAQQMPDAEYVVVWDTDRAQLVKVKIEH